MAEMSFRRVERVTGPSSYRVSLVGRSILGLWLALLVAVGVIVAARPSHPSDAASTLFFSVLWSWIGVSVVIFISIGGVQVQMRRERKRGYTWSTDQYQNLDQIDPVSYVVIREAGEAYLSKPQRIERVARARVLAAEH